MSDIPNAIETEKITVAFLQNQWGVSANPNLAKRIASMSVLGHTTFVENCLFNGCRTGQNLTNVFGGNICNITWQNSSRSIGDKSDAKFSADIEHINGVLRYYRPHVVLAFGAVARAGLARWMDAPHLDTGGTLAFTVITGPHPTARHAAARDELEEMYERWVAAVQREAPIA